MDHDAHYVFCRLCLIGKIKSKWGRGSVINIQENEDLNYKAVKFTLDIVQYYFQG